MHLTRDAFAAWLTGYVEAWRSGDPATIGALFTEDAVYSFRAGDEVVEGREAIVRAWLEEDEEGSWEAYYEPLAIDDEIHVAIGTTKYFDEGGLPRDEYSNIFVCRFDDAGRCSGFTEWWMRGAGPVGRLD
jgi:ketosteroid isomerase-like protein